MGNSNEERGSIAFFSTYRPPIRMDIYSSPISPCSYKDELLKTDGKSYNYNGREIPPGALKTILKYTKMGDYASPCDVTDGYVTGLVFVSERTNNLETLHFALCFDSKPPKVNRVFNFAQLYNTYCGVRMEDSGCFAANRFLIYVSTKEANAYRRQPWTAVFRTDLRNGQTVRLTPPGVADFSPSVSPCGEKIAVATTEHSGGWNGEIEKLKTDIIIMNVTQPYNRRMVIRDGGWPSWGSSNIIYFHRATPRLVIDGKTYYNWGVFRAQICDGYVTSSIERITPCHVDAMTPAAISINKVAVAIIRNRLDLNQPRNRASNYRHIEVFDFRSKKSLPVTRIISPLADHYNPFVIPDYFDDDVLQIGYSCCIGEQLQKGDVSDKFERLQYEDEDEVEVFRVPGMFPTFTSNGQKLAFVDNDFQKVYLADSRGGLRAIFSVSDLPLPEEEKKVFSPVWNQNPLKDELYICVGPPFCASKQVHIYGIFNASTCNTQVLQITSLSGSNDAFPSTNPEGTKLVFRSTRDWLEQPHRSPIRPKNLYILTFGGRGIMRSTTSRISNGDWIDTQCQWSPNGQWIVFSSTRDKPWNAPELDHGLDPGYYSIYLMKACDSNVVVKVLSSDRVGAGHVNHPMFSPDGQTIVFSADLAAVSAEPISLPLFLNSVRPYGDIFSVDIDMDDIFENKDLSEYKRVTHSRYENSTPNWSMFSTRNLNGAWKRLFKDCHRVTWRCPYSDGGAETWKLTGHLGLSKRCC